MPTTLIRNAAADQGRFACSSISRPVPANGLFWASTPASESSNCSRINTATTSAIAEEAGVFALALFLVVLWVRWSWMRLRIDQALNVNWKILFPISLVNLLAAGWWVLARGAGS